MTDLQHHLRSVEQNAPPDLWGRIEAGPLGPPQVGERTSRRVAAAIIALVIFGGAAWFLGSAFWGDEGRIPAEESSFETGWFVATVPDGWTTVHPDGARVGRGLLAAQFTSFDAGGPVCIDSGAFPDDGILLRLTLGSESSHEECCVTPSPDRSLRPPKVFKGEVIGFIDPCGVDQELFAKFFGPDGHVLMAHVLIGPAAAPDALAEVESILDSLAPTDRDAPLRTPEIEEEIAFAEGEHESVGRWVMSVRYPADATISPSLWFSTRSHSVGISLEQSGGSLPWVLGTGLSPDRRFDSILLIGAAPASARGVVLKPDGRVPIDAQLIPLPSGVGFEWAYWAGPFEGTITAEGTSLDPGATWTITDDNGVVIERHRLD